MNVLVVDDDPDYGFLVRLALGDVASVVCAVTADEAVDRARDCPPDLALIDASMPGAFAVIPDLRSAVDGLRVVLVSLRPAGELASAAAAAGAVGYIGKDLAPSGLPEVIRQLDAVVGAVQHFLARRTRDLPADGSSAAAARRFVHGAIVRWCDDDLVDAVVLLVSEVVTNAVVHTQSAPAVAVEIRPGTIHVEVSDNGVVVDGPGTVSEDGTSGRGLLIVESVAERWGCRPRSGGGKTVWFDIRRQPDGATEPVA